MANFSTTFQDTIANVHRVSTCPKMGPSVSVTQVQGSMKASLDMTWNLRQFLYYWLPLFYGHKTTLILDYNECEQSGFCSNGICVNARGSFQCECREGKEPWGHPNLKGKEEPFMNHTALKWGFFDLQNWKKLLQELNRPKNLKFKHSSRIPAFRERPFLRWHRRMRGKSQDLSSRPVQKYCRR